MEQSHRWKHISFYHAIPADFRHEIFNRPRDLGLLHSLYIDGADDMCIVESPVLSTFSDAPSLREVEIRGFALFQGIELPWNQLEKLRGQGDSLDVYNVLSQGHNLIDCEFWVDDSGEDLNHLQRIMVPKLQRFTLDGFVGFSRALDLPSLTYLNHIRDFNFNNLSQLIEYSSCPLKDLFIYAPVLEADFMRCMRLLPSLTTLDIHSTTSDGALSPHFLEGLILSEDENILLPNLEILKYHGVTAFHFKTLFTVLRQRHRNQENLVSQLKCVSIRSMNNIPGFDTAAMEDLATLVNLEEGLKLEITVPNSEGRGNSFVSG